MNATDFALLNDWQRDFPLVPTPFTILAEQLDCAEGDVIAALKRLSAAGSVSRIGAVFAPRRMGASTLAAIAAPIEDLERIADLVSARQEVNHNYQREHRYNLWFVVIAEDQGRLNHALASIEHDTGCAVLSMPLEREYHIDLGFDLGGKAKRNLVQTASPSEPDVGAPWRMPGEAEQKLIAALHSGLAIEPRPFRELAVRCDSTEEAVLQQLQVWLNDGLIKRFGVVVRHHELGYAANAMVVFDIPDCDVDAVGTQMAAEPGVTLCYRRSRNLPGWPYNLYCMVHGRRREDVGATVEILESLARRPANTLFSTRRFKQCGARYFATSIAEPVAHDQAF